MIKVSVLYPNSTDAKFDMDYYCNKHIPMVRNRLGSACRQVAVEEGLSGGDADAPAAYIAMGHLLFDSVESFGAAFGPNADAILGDIPNYTDIAPVMQVSDVKI